MSCVNRLFVEKRSLTFWVSIEEKAIEQGEHISVEVWGQFPESLQRTSYFVVFKDSLGKFRYVYIIKEGSEISNVLKHMFALAKSMGHKIKEFLSDNAIEKLKQFYIRRKYTKTFYATTEWIEWKRQPNNCRNRKKHSITRILKLVFLMQCCLN